MEAKELSIPGCYEIRTKVLRDDRGVFVKTLHRETFVRLGLEWRFAEEYYSVSRRGVLRGLHFQTPPRDLVKMVYCLEGEVLDAFVDLRKGSPTFGRHQTLSLTAEIANTVYLPAGLAHGFYVTSPRATLLYKVTQAYSPEHDKGVRWDSAGIPWPDDRPVVSSRDAGFPPLSDFKTPFVFGG